MRKGDAIHLWKDGVGLGTAHLRRTGAVNIPQAPDGITLGDLCLASHLARWLPSTPVRQGDVVTAGISVTSNSIVNPFALR